jgi:hypothetical protein
MKTLVATFLLTLSIAIHAAGLTYAVPAGWKPTRSDRNRRMALASFTQPESWSLGKAG